MQGLLNNHSCASLGAADKGGGCPEGLGSRPSGQAWAHKGPFHSLVGEGGVGDWLRQRRNCVRPHPPHCLLPIAGTQFVGGFEEIQIRPASGASSEAPSLPASEASAVSAWSMAPCPLDSLKDNVLPCGQSWGWGPLIPGPFSSSFSVLWKTFLDNAQGGHHARSGGCRDT